MRLQTRLETVQYEGRRNWVEWWESRATVDRLAAEGMGAMNKDWVSPHYRVFNSELNMEQYVQFNYGPP